MTDALSVAGNVADFVGAGTTSFNCTTLAGNNQVGGGANITVTQATTAGCGVSVVYTYDAPVTPPVAIPEPASMALVGLGMLGLAAVRRRK